MSGMVHIWNTSCANFLAIKLGSMVIYSEPIQYIGSTQKQYAEHF